MAKKPEHSIRTLSVEQQKEYRRLAEKIDREEKEEIIARSVSEGPLMSSLADASGYGNAC